MRVFLLFIIRVTAGTSTILTVFGSYSSQIDRTFSHDSEYVASTIPMKRNTRLTDGENCNYIFFHIFFENPRDSHLTLLTTPSLNVNVTLN